MTLAPAVADAIVVRGLAKDYGARAGLRGIDLAVHGGEIFGLIGPDGAGKTTTFHILAGIMEPTAGTASLLGRRPRDARADVGYLTQRFSLFLDLSVDENLRYAAGVRDVTAADLAARRERYLRLLDLDRAAGRLAAQLSGGMKQKLALCAALIAEPRILLLDEPTTGVDPVSRREFWRILARLADGGMTIVVATPYLDEAERCHRIALIHEGTLRALGTPAEIRASLPLQRLEIRTANAAAAEGALQAEAGSGAIADVQGFGDRVDVLVADAAAGTVAVRATLAARAIAIDAVTAQQPTLENVFVARLRELGSDVPYVPFPDHAVLARQQAGVAIRADGLSRDFGDVRAVDAVSLRVGYGEIYGLLGANGAGKTTIIKMLCGLLAPSSGSVALDGAPDGLRTASARRRLGYMSQKFTLYDDLSIRENLRFYASVYGLTGRERDAKIEWVLEMSGLRDAANLLTRELPGGWRQRVAFGAAVLHRPAILFLDEPTSGVDPLARRQFWRSIDDFARDGTAIIVTTHYLEEAEHCHRLCFMVAGRMVAEGSPEQIKAQQPGRLFEIATDAPQRAADLIETLYPHWRVALFGDRLHFVAEHDDELADLRHRLEAAHVRVTATRPVPFSLEDAFIGTTERSASR